MPGELWTLSRRAKAPQVLMIDDHVPGTRPEARMPRAAELLRALIDLSAQITLLSTRDDGFDHTLGLPALRLRGDDDLGRVLAARTGRFAAIFVARPGNMALVADVVARGRLGIGDFLVVYDAELPPSARGEAAMEEEIASAGSADVVLALEATSADLFTAAGHPDVRVLGYAVAPQFGLPFAARRGFVTLAATYGDGGDIAGAVAWFADRILPSVHERLGRAITLAVAGEDPAALARPRGDHSVEVPGRRHDVALALDRARVFVAPQQAGDLLPLNVYDAIARGLAAVLTPAQAQRIGWRHGREALVARTDREFADACVTLYRDQMLWEGLRANARARIDAEVGRTRFDALVRDVLARAVGAPR